MRSGNSLNILFLILLFFASRVCATIDVNLSELEYLSARLEPAECRRLVAALHFDNYELPEKLAEAEREIGEQAPCLAQLLHWNSTPSEGAGKTHEHIQHRLRQIGRNDLADWLGRTTFRELGKDLLKAVADLGKSQRCTTGYSPTPETFANADDEASDNDDNESDNKDVESFWQSIEVVLIGLFTVSLFTLCFFVGALAIDRFAWCDDDEDEGNDIDDRAGDGAAAAVTGGKKLPMAKRRQLLMDRR